MENIENLKFMSIGGNCMCIPCLGNLRVHGPIDNIKSLKGPKSGIMALLHPDEVYKELTGPCKFQRSEGRWQAIYFENFAIYHNDPTTEKYHKELKRRLDVLQDFYKKINEDDHYFVYSLNPGDVKISDDHSRYVLTDLCKEGIEELRNLNILSKVIFIGSVMEKFISESYFVFNADDLYDIPDVKYIEIKNVGTVRPELISFSHEQFIRNLKKL